MVLNFKAPTATEPLEIREAELVVLGSAHCDLLDQLSTRLRRGTADLLHLAVRSLAKGQRVATDYTLKRVKEEDDV